MTERTPPLNLQNATTHTAAGDRALIHSIFGGREGVAGSTDLAVSQNGSPNMSVNIAAGRGVVFGDTASDQQLYHIWNDATVNKTISAADPTNPRRDLIVAEVRDHFMDGGGSNDWRLRVITGTPAGSPADPALPNNCLLLARVAVAAAASSITNANITDLRPRAGTVGSCDVICTSTTRPAVPFVGMKIYETDTAKELVYAGPTSGWNQPWNQPWGIIARTADITTHQTGVSTKVDITGASVSFTAVAGRHYRATLVCETYGSSAPNYLGLYLNVGGSDKRTATFPITMVSVQNETPISCDFTASAGSLTVKASIIAGSAGTVAVFSTSSAPTYLYVEDIGPAGLPS